MKAISKKLGAIVLALAMCFSLACVAFADGPHTITIEESIVEKTYSAYKVFDVTVNGDAIAYTISSDSAWFELIDPATSATSPFTVKQIGDSDSTTYEVTWTDDTSATTYLQGLTVPEDASAAATETATGTTTTLTVAEDGYYFITTGNGTTVTLSSVTADVTVMEKNNEPGQGGKIPGDPDWEGGFTKDTSSESHAIGDEFQYVIRAYAPTYDKENKIVDYTFTDTMGEGLTYDEDLGVKVEIISSSGTEGSWVDITDYCTISVVNNVLTVTYTIESIPDYPADAVVQISYYDYVNEAADETDLTNTVGLTWHSTTPEGDEETGEYGGDDPKETVYTYGFDLKKVDSSENVLTGAEFTLADANGTITFIYDNTSDTYEVWDKETEGTTTTTIKVADGELNIWGLGAGTYTLTETVAPDGYNLLENPVTIVIEAAIDETSGEQTGWTVTVSGDNASSTSNGSFGENDDGHGVATMPTITITNNAGSVLPGTGGIGTTIFYIIGGVLVAGAVVVLITRRRMSSAD